MRSNAMQLWNADSRHNLLFSVHMYEVYQTPAPIIAYMQAFDDMGLPLVIGEFGPQNNGQPVDVETIFTQAQQRGNGYIGWSWSGNGSGGVALDMVQNFSTTFTPWGNRIVNGTNGIRATSVRATVFAQVGDSLNVSPTSLSFGAGASSSPATVTANVGWTVTDNQTWLSVAPTSGTNNGSFTVSATANNATTNRSGTVTVSGNGISRAITVMQAGQGSPTGSVTATGVVTSGSGWFTEEQLRLSNTANITALSIAITVQRTTGVSASGQYNTVGGTISQSNTGTASAITYVFSLSSGQMLTPGTNRTFAAQMSGNGMMHPTAGDTYSVTGTAGGQLFTLNGTF
jgi:mannan endo-1,4-beta-mannosidase